MKDFSSTLERQRNRERESRNPYGYWPCSHESKRENWADFALKVFIFKNCVVPHRGDNVSTYISSAKKKKDAARSSKGDIKLWKVFHSESCPITNFHRHHLLNIFILSARLFLWPKSSFPLPPWPSCSGSLTSTLEVPSRSTNVHKDKILTILRTIGSLRTQPC